MVQRICCFCVSDIFHYFSYFYTSLPFCYVIAMLYVIQLIKHCLLSAFISFITPFLHIKIMAAILVEAGDLESSFFDRTL